MEPSLEAVRLTTHNFVKAFIFRGTSLYPWTSKLSDILAHATCCHPSAVLGSTRSSLVKVCPADIITYFLTFSISPKPYMSYQQFRLVLDDKMFVYKSRNNLAHHLQSCQDSLQPYYENVIVLASFHSLVQNCVEHYSQCNCV